MVSKRKLLGLAVVLGIALGVACQLRRMPSRGRCLVSATESTGAPVPVLPTNVVPVLVTNAVVRSCWTNAVATAASSTNAAVGRKTGCLPVANDPQVPKGRQVLLANRRIVVGKGRSFPKAFCAKQTPTSRGTAPYVVISELPVGREARIRAVADGARVIGFLPNNALMVEADAETLKNLEEDVLFLAAVEYEPSDKMQRTLLEGRDASPVTVALLNPRDSATVRDFIVENGGSRVRTSADGRTIDATISCALVAKLAERAEVKWIGRAR